MTDKELHKLGRRELLQLLLAQAREAEEAKQSLKETQQKLSELEEGYERLKHRLDDKDIRILKLRNALREQIDKVDPSLAPSPAQLSELLEISPMAEGRHPEQEGAKPKGEESKEQSEEQAKGEPKEEPEEKIEESKEEKKESIREEEETGTSKQENSQASSEASVQVMEVVQVIGGKMQPKSKMSLPKKMAKKR